MPIDYTFTDRGTIQIACGTDWIEVRLPAGPPSAPDSPKPVSDGETQTASPAVPPRAAPEPQVKPGVMAVVAGLGNSSIARNLIDLDSLGFEGPEPLDATLLLHVNPLSQAPLSELIRRSVKEVDGLKIIDLVAGSEFRRTPNALARAKQLLRQQNYTVDAMRLWFPDTSDK